MNTDRFWRLVWLPVLAVAVLSWGIADQGRAQEKEKKSVAAASKATPKKKKTTRYTQAQREAAADRLKAAQAKARAKAQAKTQSKTAPAARALVGRAAQLVTPEPGGQPDYFTVSNWAFSPSPKGAIETITVENGGSGYHDNPTVTITGPIGSGATATATLGPNGSIASIAVTAGGSGYAHATVTITDTPPVTDPPTPAGTGATAVATIGGPLTGGIRKFVDTLPGLGAANANNLGQFLSVAVPDTITFPGSDYYVIELQQYTQQMHSDLPPTTLRGYVQVNNGTDKATNQNTVTPAPIRYLGPTIVAQKNRPVRIKFTNKLPTGAGGDLFIPVDTTVMGAGMGPIEGEMFKQNRGVLHLHGGKTPWISDGTPHQWITPAGETTSYPIGASAKKHVPDMWFDAAGNPVAAGTAGATNDPGPGSMTYYYSNQQSARLLFYHDHAWGITRLNVYAGEAAGYLITDDVETGLVNAGLIPAEQIPLVIQEKSFVDAELVRDTDPTWNWGTGAANGANSKGQPILTPKTGDLWMSHVYVPAQNPFDIEGVNPFGRWHFSPWFWPPATVKYPPIPNPYYDAANPENTPGQYQEVPATPNPAMGMEMFCDTPTVNGTAYPTLTVQPKAYRFRILNAANDRFVNLQLYEADPNAVAPVSADPEKPVAQLTEVKMLPADTGMGFPESWPTDGRAGGVPDPTTAGPNWIQIGTEGGFLPAPVVIPCQPINWNLDPTTFNFGNVSDHSLLVAPAERADVVVDFSQHAGKTFIVYNDAPAAFPALDARYDYYTGAPDLRDTGGHWGPKAGYGPNTRTIMQIKVADADPAQPFNLVALENAFKTTGPAPEQQGVFAKGQDPIIVGQTAYNSAYNTTFPSTYPNWGVVRIQDNKMSFNTVAGVTVTDFPLGPKAIQDETSEAFDHEYGRMSGNLGLEMPKTIAGGQNFMLYGYESPPVEILKGIASATPLTSPATDGTQIWKITHNGVDTHPIHFHLYDVQLINRVGWDGAIRLPDANELGWKDTVRISPLEDTTVALRPRLPDVPFKLPNSVRLLNPAMPEGEVLYWADEILDTLGNPVIDPSGIIDPVTGLQASVVNRYVNFGWEYVWHCHILSHEEMDMMHSVVVAVPPDSPSNLTANYNGTSGVVLTWTDNSANEVGFTIQRAADAAFTAPLTTFQVAADVTTYTDTTVVEGQTYHYRVFASNTVGDTTVYGGDPDVVGFPNETLVSGFSNAASAAVTPPATAPAAPTGLTATPSVLSENPPTVTLNWTDNANNEAGFTIQRARNSNFTNTLTTFTVGANVTTFADPNFLQGTRYWYRVRATNAAGASGWSNAVNLVSPGQLPAAPTNLTFVSATRTSITYRWTDNSTNDTGFTLQRARNANFNPVDSTVNVGATVTQHTSTGRARNTTYFYRVRARNAYGVSPWSNVLEAKTLP